MDDDIRYAEEMYKEHILDLYKNPLNFGPHEATHIKRGFNPLCGDDITLYLTLKDGVIQKATFTGKACAICTAATSLITDKVTSMTHDDARSLTKEDVLAMLHIPISTVRMKCALLPLDTVHSALEGEEGYATTEEHNQKINESNNKANTKTNNNTGGI